MEKKITKTQIPDASNFRSSWDSIDPVKHAFKAVHFALELTMQEFKWLRSYIPTKADYSKSSFGWEALASLAIQHWYFSSLPSKPIWPLNIFLFSEPTYHTEVCSLWYYQTISNFQGKPNSRSSRSLNLFCAHRSVPASCSHCHSNSKLPLNQVELYYLTASLVFKRQCGIIRPTGKGISKGRWKNPRRAIWICN